MQKCFFSIFNSEYFKTSHVLDITKTLWSWGRMYDICTFFRKKRGIKTRRQQFFCVCVADDHLSRENAKTNEMETKKVRAPGNEQPVTRDRARSKKGLDLRLLSVNESTPFKGCGCG